MKRAIPLAVIGLIVLGTAILFTLNRSMIRASKETADANASQKPNVVIVLFDTLRPDYLGPYGSDPKLSSFITQLAKESTVFTRAFSTSSWTAPSTASLFTGVYPTEHGVVMGLGAHEEHIEHLEQKGEAAIGLNSLPTQLATLPEIFRANGYLAVGLSSNRHVGKEIGFNRGFNAYYSEFGQPAEVVYDRLIPWSERVKDQSPYFCYVHLNDMHQPYYIREPFYSKLDDDITGDKRKYTSQVGYIDLYLRKIYELMVADRDTILILLSDHGEEFQDHGMQGHGPRLYREVNQVLMMAHSPKGRRIKSRQIDVNVNLIDVFPTLLDLCGLDPVDTVQGKSLAPLLRTGSKNSTAGKLRTDLRERTLFAHRATRVSPDRARWAATFQHWKLYEPLDRAPELYDHRVDFAEQNNLFEQEPEMAQLLTNRLAEFKKTMRDNSDSLIEVQLDPELLETLESLGYVE